jgi:2-oxoisovalerate dehydrogenase E1 component
MAPTAARAAATAELLAELRAFLSFEAPHLIADLPRSASAEELELHLVERLAALHRLDPETAARGFAPGLTLGEAASRGREALVELVRGFFARRRLKASLTDAERRLMFRTMLLARALDDALKLAFDRKELKWGDYPSPQKGFRATGQEAIVGAALRLRRPPEYPPGEDYRGDVIAPLIRDLPAALMFRPDPLHPMLAQAGLEGTPMGGRDLHIGDLAWGVLPPAAPLAISAQTAVGLAYAWKLGGEERVVVSCIGDGGTSLGEWHEAINFAGVQRLAVVFVVQNNRWALGTPVGEQTAASRFALRASGYGMPGATVFGNDPDEVAAACAWAAERARGGAGPTLVELLTYRRSGHAHHDDDRFHGNPRSGIPGYELDEEARLWEAADPLALYAERLSAAGLLEPGEAEGLRREVQEEVASAAAQLPRHAWPEPADYRERVYAPRRRPRPAEPAEPRTRRMAYDEAVRQALVEMMAEDPSVFVLGEDVGGRYGGAFGVTRGLAKQFGAGRCLNTPLAESAIVGCAVGAALMGLRPVAEMQFADFLASGFNALVNNAAKLYWRWGRAVPMVVRLPYGGATGTMNRLLGGGPFHSQCPEMWFLRTPGWKVVAPSTPGDAKGLLIAALRDENPVLYLEAKGLYGLFRPDLREEVPLGTAHEVPFGRAAVRRPGSDLTLLTYGAMVWTALEAAATLAGEGVSAEVVDLRSLWPLDETTILESVGRTHRALVLHEDTRRGGLGGELAALITERAFWQLDAPLVRVTAPDTPVPYSPPLEHDFLPKAEQVVAAARDLVRQ